MALRIAIQGNGNAQGIDSYVYILYSISLYTSDEIARGFFFSFEKQTPNLGESWGSGIPGSLKISFLDHGI